MKNCKLLIQNTKREPSHYLGVGNSNNKKQKKLSLSETTRAMEGITMSCGSNKKGESIGATRVRGNAMERAVS